MRKNKNRGYLKSRQITEEDFERLDSFAFKIENGLLKLVERLEEKRDRGEWIDHLMVKECNAVYGTS
ncbi:MAG: hypothetical protein R6V46_01700 [Desulfatiglandaceae bacterium]